jgi:hypothetical protein
MKHIYLILFYILANVSTISAQMTLAEINRRLDIHPYFDIWLDYNTNITLPDSIKVKMMNALERKLPQHFIDSVFNFSEEVFENIRNYAWQQCKKDTACFEKVYAERYAMNIESGKRNYSSRCLSQSLILSCGSWGITEAIPYLEKELEKEYCTKFGEREYIEMALAKLGNDSIFKHLKESYTLSYLIKHTELDTVDNKIKYSIGTVDDYIQSGYKYYNLAAYLNDKDFLYNMLDLLYLKGQVLVIDWDYGCVEGDLLRTFSWYLFNDNPQYHSWEYLCDRYYNIYREAEKDRKKYKTVSSHAYKQTIIAELRQWIDENVNFE